jgi:hypothetical protein
LERILMMTDTKPAQLLIVLFGASLAAMAACEVQPGPSKSGPVEKGNMMATRNDMFEKIQVGELSPNACSPQPTDAAFKGILINAPSEVSYKKGQRIGRRGVFARVPVCGYYRLGVPSPPRRGTILEAMTLVAVDVDTGRRYAGPMMDPDPSVPPPAREPLPKAVVANITVSGYFNPNLAEYAPLPAKPATYEVHVELDNMKSNVMKIKLVEAGD